MEADLLAHDPGLDDVADDGDDDVHHQQGQGPSHVAAQGGEDGPGDHDAAGAQHRQDVENGDQQGHQQRPLHADDAQPDGQLHEGDGHDQGVGADAHEQRAHHIGLDLQHHVPGVPPEAAQDEADDLLIVDGDEEGGDHHQQQPDQKTRQGGGEGSGRTHAAHQQRGQHGHQLPEHVDQLGLQLLQHRHQGGVQLGQQVLQPGEGVREGGEDVGVVEPGDLLHQGCDGGDQADAGQGQQGADEPVGEDHQQHRHQPLGHMQRPREEADGPPQDIGDHKGDHEGHQQRQGVLERDIAQRQDQRQMGHIHNELFLFLSCRHQCLRSAGVPARVVRKGTEPAGRARRRERDRRRRPVGRPSFRHPAQSAGKWFNLRCPRKPSGRCAAHRPGPRSGSPWRCGPAGR